LPANSARIRPIVVSGRHPSYLPLGIDGAVRAELAQGVGPDSSTSLGCGFGRFEWCEFPWRLTYDECVFIVSGSMTVIWEGRRYRVDVGDGLFLPKGIEIEYHFEEPCHLFYVTYPVNWAATREEDLRD
jgi:ethanolamine utilization protein EutQ